MKKIQGLSIALFLVHSIFAQTAQSTAVSTIRDSLEFIYNERFQQQLDSMSADFELEKQKFLNKYNVERDQYAKKIRSLADSLNTIQTTPSTPAAPLPATMAVQDFDPNIENLYFTYLTRLKDREKKSTSFFGKLGLGGEKIIDFQLTEIDYYLARYFPGARCDQVQSYRVELLFDQKLYAQAEMEFLKYAYLYNAGENYTLTLDKHFKALRENRYFSDRISFINQKVNSILKNRPLSERYFNFIELLSSYPENQVKAFFVPEAAQYLTRFADQPAAAEVIFWMAQNYKNAGDPQKALITADKVMTIYPGSPGYSEALYFKARLQLEEFKEYKEAIASFESFISNYPDNTKTRNCYFTIAKIYDENLKEYENAVNYYRQYADQFKTADNAVFSLQRTAEIYNKELKSLLSAVDTYSLIQERYPNTEAGKLALFTAASIYEEKKYYKNAVVQYAEVYKNYPKAEESLTAMERSAVLYLEKLEDIEKGKELLQMIISYFPKSKSADEARERLKALAPETPPAGEQEAPKQDQRQENSEPTTRE